MTLPRQCELVSPHAVDFPTDAALAIPRRLRKSPVLSAARHFSGAARPMDILSLKDSQILFGEGAILPKVSYSSRFEGIATFMGTTSKILEPIVTIVKWSDICCIIPSLWGRDMNILQQLFLPSKPCCHGQLFPLKFSAPNILSRGHQQSPQCTGGEVWLAADQWEGSLQIASIGGAERQWRG